jgi:hypothetical protein
MTDHKIRKVATEGKNHDVVWDYRWICSCGMKSAWFTSAARRDAAVNRHLAKNF